MTDQSFRVYLVNNPVSVLLHASCKYNKFIVDRKFLQEFSQIRSDVEKRIQALFYKMNQSLIQIQN